MKIATTVFAETLEHVPTHDAVKLRRGDGRMDGLIDWFLAVHEMFANFGGLGDYSLPYIE
jgi:hypothetical protein